MVQAVLAFVATGACAVALQPASASVDQTLQGGASDSPAAYEVSDVHYVPSARQPGAIKAVTFAISPTPQTLRIRLASDGRWHDCTASANRARCPLAPSESAKGITSLEFVANS